MISADSEANAGCTLFLAILGVLYSKRLAPSQNHLHPPCILPQPTPPNPVPRGMTSSFGVAQIPEEYTMTHCRTRSLSSLIDFRLLASLASSFGTIPSASLLNCAQLKIYFVQEAILI